MAVSKYAVIGNPVEHSKSPFIHQEFARQTNIRLQYGKLLSAVDAFPATLRDFQHAGGRGVNVTVPFKQLAFEICTEISDYAKTAKAVNTILFKNEKQWIGTNTDGIGLIQDIKSNLKIELYGRRTIILGAGGATRGIIEPLLNEGVDELTVVNRTVSKALELAKEFNILAGDYQSIRQPYDLVINATSASLDQAIPPVPENLFTASSLSYDLMYANEPTAFLNWSKKHGASIVADGLGMLIEQAAAAFYFWHGIRPQTAPLFTLLRAE